MNPRRVHDLMREKFPTFDAATLEWSNMHDGNSFRKKEFDAFLRRTIDAREVIVEVHRKLGTLLPIEEAADFIGSHVGEGQIRVANREFSSFVVVASNGVAAGWIGSGCEPTE